MSPEIKAKWVAALRSGGYVQGKGKMREDNKFCCLGVLADLCAQETGQPFEAMTRDDGTLPAEFVVRWAGLSNKNPKLSIGGNFGTCVNHNDNDFEWGDATFAKIADAIEAQL